MITRGSIFLSWTDPDQCMEKEYNKLFKP